MGDHAPTAWSHEHQHLSLQPFPTSVAAGQTHISHPVSGPWAHVPTWILAVASPPRLPRLRAWLGWTQVAQTVTFVAWPKA